jgi:hypothetical protein
MTPKPPSPATLADEFEAMWRERCQELGMSDQDHPGPAILAKLRSPDASGEYARGLTDAAAVCMAEAAQRDKNFNSKDPNWPDPMAQGHKAITARMLAADILALADKAPGGEIEMRTKFGFVRVVVMRDDPDVPAHIIVNVEDSTYDGTEISVHRDLVKPDPTPSTSPEAVKPAPGQGELHYYTLGPNADRVCTRCEFNISADARDHQWVHDQKRDEAVRAEREACAKIADGYTCGACGMDGKCAAEIRSRATAAEKEEGT